MFCSNCGYELKNGESVCVNCGTTAGGERASASRLKSTFGEKKSTCIGVESFQRSEVSPSGTYNSACEAPVPVERGLRDSEIRSSLPGDYSSPREYVRKKTNDHGFINFLAAIALVACVLFLPTFPTLIGDGVRGVELLEPCRKILGQVLSEPDSMEYMKDIVMGAICILIYILSAFGVLLGALFGSRGLEKFFSVLGIIISFFLIFGFMAAADGNSDFIECGMLVNAALFVLCNIFAPKKRR